MSVSAAHDVVLPEQVIKSRFNPVIVTAAYFASLTGCFLTIELLHRRTTGMRNLASWLYTFACALSLSFIGIWCMHFIGNRAIILGDNQARIQLVYSAGFTVLSVFLPFIGLLGAFSTAEYPYQYPVFRRLAVSFTGILAGLSIVGMHYIGNFAISNYHLHYQPRFLAASIIIAIGDAWLVLALFYTWREKWINNMWKRLLCAMLLAGGISAMHFTAATKCEYEFKAYDSMRLAKTRNAAVVAAGSFCFAALILLGVVIGVSRYQVLKHRTRAKQVTVAVAIFDDRNRLLVNPDGTLPCRKIAEKYKHRTFDDDFDAAHPVFHWIFRVSRNWSAIMDLIPKMKSHYSANKKGQSQESGKAGSRSSIIYPSETYNDFTILFREGFCTAVASLAASLHLTIDRMGVLYDQIIDTGLTDTLDNKGPRFTLWTSARKSGPRVGDMESNANPATFGRGQLLLLVRKLNHQETTRLSNAGLRFAFLEYVSRSIADQFQMPLAILDGHMVRVLRYIADQIGPYRTGTYLGIFTLFANPHSKSFDVIVRREAPDELPMLRILERDPQKWHVEYLQQYHGSTAIQVIQIFQAKKDSQQLSPIHLHFVTNVLQALTGLQGQLPAHWFHRAKLHAKPFEAIFAQSLRQQVTRTSVFAFVLCDDMNTSIAGNRFVTKAPLTFFNARHMCYTGSPNHRFLVRQIHQEFSPLFTQETTTDAAAKIGKLVGSIFKVKRHRRNASQHSLRPLSFHCIGDNPHRFNQTKENLEMDDFSPSSHSTSAMAMDSEPGTDRPRTMDGIMVNNETMILNDSQSQVTLSPQRNGLAPVTTTTHVSAVVYEPTFVDTLVEITQRTIPRFSFSPSTTL